MSLIDPDSRAMAATVLALSMNLGSVPPGGEMTL
jgi:hypothetical protein